jgi:prepilin-type N-terminal cleavage/methylation domain-containing protein
MSRIDRNKLKLRSGFTLIELLAVIAVLSALVAILLPALNMVRSLGKRVVCASNLKQMGLAWQLYVNDNDRCFPRYPSAHVRYGGWPARVYEENFWENTWRDRPLNPYMILGAKQEISEKAARVYCCPADRGGAGKDGYTTYEYYGTSYATNTCLIGPDKFPISADYEQVYREFIEGINYLIEKKNMTPERVTNSHQQVVLAGDMGWYYQWWAYRELQPDKKTLLEWHKKHEHYNILMLDGHEEFIKIREGKWLVEGEYYINPFQEFNYLARQIE